MVLIHHDKAKTLGRKTPAQGRGSNTATNGVFQRVSIPFIVGNNPTALKAKKAQKRWPALGHKVRFAALSRRGGPFPHPGFAN
jgi:hypothetical protein